MLTGYYQRNKERLSKKASEKCKNLFAGQKDKSANMLVSDIE